MAFGNLVPRVLYSLRHCNLVDKAEKAFFVLDPRRKLGGSVSPSNLQPKPQLQTAMGKFVCRKYIGNRESLACDVNGFRII